MNPEESLKMLSLSPEDLIRLQAEHCLRTGFIARLVWMLRQIQRLANDQEHLSQEEVAIIGRLEAELESQISAVLYPALVQSGVCLIPDERSGTVKIRPCHL